jgi:septum formation protein
MAARKATIVLASGSAARRRMLEDTGIEFEVEVSDVDEDIVREALSDDDLLIEPADLAEVLARAKAEDVARRVDADIVIGADQVLSLDGATYAKPPSIAAARRQLLAFRGKAHQLHSAVAIVRREERHWTHVDEVTVTMRDYSSAFVGRYLAAVGAAALESVGCYQIEGPGVQLIEKVEGDYFTILGLPLLPLLAELRRMGVLDQ